METVFLLALGGVFAFLAYDAWRLSAPPREVPYEVTARPLGLEVDGVPLSELEKRKEWSLRHGFGDLSASYLLWAILAAGSFVAALWRALGDAL